MSTHVRRYILVGMKALDDAEKQLAKAGASEDEIAENLFEPLVADARSTLRRAMLNSRDQKLSVSVAESILDRAGKGKRNTGEAGGTQIVISDSQVQLLMQAHKEALGE